MTKGRILAAVGVKPEGINTVGGPSPQETPANPQERPKRQRRVRPGEEPLEFFPDSKALDQIVDFFGIQKSLPMSGHLVMRLGSGNQIGARKLYYVSPGAALVTFEMAGCIT